MREIRKFLRAYQSFVVSAILLVSVIAGFIFGIIPAARKTLDLRSEAGIRTRQIEDLRVKASILASVDETSYRGYLADLVSAVPPDQSLTSLFATIDGLGNETGVVLTNLALVKPGAIATESARRQSAEEKQIGTHLLPFTVTVSGSYDQIREFLARVVSVRRFFRVRRFDLSLLDPTNVLVKMDMDAYYAPYLSSIGGTDTKIDPLTPKDEEIMTLVRSMPIVGGIEVLAPQLPGNSTTEFKANPFAP